MEIEVSFMYSKTYPERFTSCGACGKRGYNKDNCWLVVGFPKGHPKHTNYEPNNNFKPKPPYSHTSSFDNPSTWNPSSSNNPRIAANAAHGT